MREVPLVFLLSLAVALGGCASSTTTGVCARAPDPDPARELAWPRSGKDGPEHSPRVARSKPSGEVAAVPATNDGTPEPRFTSAEWWMRENARLGRALTICRGCLPAVVS